MALTAKERARRWKERQKNDHEKHKKNIVDSFEKYEHTKEILLRNKVAKHPALSWHSLQKNGQNDGGRDKRMIPRNIKVFDLAKVVKVVDV